MRKPNVVIRKPSPPVAFQGNDLVFSGKKGLALAARLQRIADGTGRTFQQVLHDACEHWLQHGKIKVPIELDAETDRRAKLLCKQRGITLDELVAEYIAADMKGAKP